MAKKTIIKCPNCGREYLPGEIYSPSDFLGRPVHVIKDEEGKILFCEDGEMNLTETYTCDNCDTTFSVNASVVFKTEPVKNIFDND